MHTLRSAFESIVKEPLVWEEPITDSGSERSYTRLRSDTHSMIAVVGTVREENTAFIELTRHFRKQQLPVPELLFVSDDKMQYLLQDLGDVSLFEYMRRGRESGDFSAAEREMLVKTIARLAEFQFRGAEGLDFSVCYPQAAFDKRTVMWDLNYFKYCFLKPSGVLFSENSLENDFETMADLLPQHAMNAFLYRDFQSRNVMIFRDEPHFIDYQGGRRGPVLYDVASFLWQAKADFPDTLREELLDVYLSELQKYTPASKSDFKTQLQHFVLFRILQVLGAYGFRGYFEKKVHFLQSIPFALRNLQRLPDENFERYPYMRQIVRTMCADIPLPDTLEKNQPSGLQVTVYSFSYRKGVPEDESGNGGGYVFDCRAIHNPGRYDAYKQLTGLDRPVIDFLEKNGEIVRFLEHVYVLADQHIKKYTERGMTRLMFAFGCTGGQHRSVYSAQHLADHIMRKHGVTVKLIHRELQQ
ncbi:MAG: phosphotransferase [Bacteroidales bacterium]|jgi:aminoglycoside/choline kinase family phosphotransferase|nr:phosphotransferase [Bacteroidales bacterium]